MPKRLSAKIQLKPTFARFIERTLQDNALLELVAKDPGAAMRQANLVQKNCGLKRHDLGAFYKSLIALRKAAENELGQTVSYSEVFNAVFAHAIGKESRIADESTGCHTGYNEGWSNSSGSTATTECGTHRVFRYDMDKGPLLNPAEAVVLESRLKQLIAQFGKAR